MSTQPWNVEVWDGSHGFKRASWYIHLGPVSHDDAEAEQEELIHGEGLHPNFVRMSAAQPASEPAEEGKRGKE